MSDAGLSSAVKLTGVILGGSIAAAIYYLFYTSKPSKTHKDRNAKPHGLYNLGNTCYSNALLQGLASLPAFTTWLRSFESRKEETMFVNELRHIILAVNNETSDEVLNAGGVTSALALHNWNIVIGVEHDLYELLNVFITSWDEELKKSCEQHRLQDSSLSSFISNELAKDSLDVKLRKQFIYDRYSSVLREETSLRPPCFGTVVSELRCCQASCLFKKVRYDPFSVISLTIPKSFNGMPMTIEALLRKYFCMEVIRGATCDRCKERSGKCDSGLLKKQGFSKLPQTLIIRIERVGVLPSGAVFKHADNVQFGETLDVRDLCFYRNTQRDYDVNQHKKSEARAAEDTSMILGGAEQNDRPRTFNNTPQHGLVAPLGTIDGGSFVAEGRELARYKYQLRAVSEHRGALGDTGHFVTYRRGLANAPHSWYITNDAHVARVPYMEVSRAQAYMLYYERIQPLRSAKRASYTLSSTVA